MPDTNIVCEILIKLEKKYYNQKVMELWINIMNFIITYIRVHQAVKEGMFEEKF